LDDLVRLACSTDPEEPVRRPRRLAIAPLPAIIAVDETGAWQVVRRFGYEDFKMRLS